MRSVLKKMSILMSIVAVIFVGCSDPTTSGTSTSAITNDGIKDLNKTLPTTSVWKKTITLTSAKDTVTFALPLIKGNSYAGSKISGDWIDAYIKTGTQNQYISNGFVATTTGEATVSFYGYTYDTYPKTCTYEIKTMAAGGSAHLNGDWIVTKIESGAFGVKQVFTYSENECDEYITIRNDSVFTASVSTNWKMSNAVSDTIRTYGAPIVGNWMFEEPYSLTGDIIVVGSKTTNGYGYQTMRKTSTPLSGITWKERLFDPTAAGLIGTWYLSADYERYQEIENGIVDEEDIDDTTYASPALSYQIFDIRKDSIIVYSRSTTSDGKTTLTQRTAYSKAAWASNYLRYSSLLVSVNSFTVEEAWGESDEVEHDKSTYTKFTGAVPPAEWPKGTITRNQSEESSKRRFSLLK